MGLHLSRTPHLRTPKHTPASPSAPAAKSALKSSLKSHSRSPSLPITLPSTSHSSLTLTSKDPPPSRSWASRFSTGGSQKSRSFWSIKGKTAISSSSSCDSPEDGSKQQQPPKTRQKAVRFSTGILDHRTSSC
ncbi:hypothetical protein BDV98DRAFT_561994 [Pterulicium gracile]|uniref:Uncharacterized protein n=1 Tax=Pterulicium gracile TaxID=1884261 RepID=A0A5C3QYE5_9AGAR|nr:hypothetical protein BDV98DRAFT_561994 [Pterula gracilis]